VEEAEDLPDALRHRPRGLGLSWCGDLSRGAEEVVQHVPSDLEPN
jgi:hypothetical protein